jgi:transcriptional regulator with XRE-family HTH domain
MTNNTLAMSIRAKKLAVLMRAARQKAGKSAAECAEALGISLEEYESYELGETSPSLPQTELLAYSLNVPLDHFYGDGSIKSLEDTNQQFKPEQIVLLRQRMVGVMVKKARLEADLSLESIADEIGVDPLQLEEFELGEKPIPLPVLEAISHFYGRSIKDFQDKHGPVGQWIRRQAIVREVLELPPDLQTFVCLPVNRPYIDLAKRLSEMSVEKLRAVAEGLLEITL